MSARKTILLAALMVAGNLFAQESDFFSQKNAYFRDEVVQGASKHPEAVTEAPATVTVLTADEIRRYGFRTMADVLNFASVGNFTHNDRRYDFAGGRGLFFFEDFNTRVLVLLNGHPLNEPWNNFGGVGREMAVPLELAERVEIVYGPSSLLYGGYSLYGLVNIVTYGGTSLGGTRATVRAGTNGESELIAAHGIEGVSGKNATRWSGLAAVGAYRSGGEDFNLAPIDGTDFGGPQSGTDTERSPFAFMTARYGEFSFMGRAGYRRKGAPMAPYGAVYGSDDEYVRDDKSFVEGMWEHEIASETMLTVRGFYDWYAYTENDPYGADEDYDVPHTFVLRADDSDTGGEMRVSSHRGTHFLAGGVEYRTRRIYQRSYQMLEGARDEESFRGDHVNGTLLVAYAQDEWRPSSHWTFVAGGTFARTEPGGRKLQPRVAAIYKPTADLSFKALYGTGFRPPSIFEAGYADYVDQINNPALESEAIRSTELSMTWNVRPAVQTQTYLFASRLRGLIGAVEIENADDVQGGVVAPSGDQNDLVGILQYQSRANVKSHGVGMAVRAAGRSTRGYVNVAYSKAKLEETGAPESLAASPSWLASGGISYQWRDFTTGVSARYVGAQRLDDSREETFESGSFFEANVRLAWDLNVSLYPVTLFLDGRNIFDSDGAVAASPIYAQPEIVIPGRQVSLGIEARF